MSEELELTPEQKKARDQRSKAIGLGLLGFVILVFVVTVFRKMQEMGLESAG
ncbi:MAG: hypothetical protein COA47_07365 [Robiginitomaculum sp.]|nr:MAG: hypothetical protein COA47_07365 [Robiginitomaculum sp.]